MLVSLDSLRPCCMDRCSVPSNRDRKDHELHLCGIFVGNVPVLVRAQLHVDPQSGCILKVSRPLEGFQAPEVACILLLVVCRLEFLLVCLWRVRAFCFSSNNEYFIMSNYFM